MTGIKEAERSLMLKGIRCALSDLIDQCNNVINAREQLIKLINF